MVVETWTAETERGRLAIREVMDHSYVADVDDVPPQWARVRVVDGQPVSFVLVDPQRQLEFHRGALRYAFICDVAAREERRREGHFRSLIKETCYALAQHGVSLAITHGRHQLYRHLGFAPFTYHSGLFTEAAAIERSVRSGAQDHRVALCVENGPHVMPDLLLVIGCRATTYGAAMVALRDAAAQARDLGKDRILFEHPPAPSYGSGYHPYETLDGPLSRAVVDCGGQHVVMGANPDSGPIPDADWARVLDGRRFLQEALALSPGAEGFAPDGRVCLATPWGSYCVGWEGGTLLFDEDDDGCTETVSVSAQALAQLVLGFGGPQWVMERSGDFLSEKGAALLESLFPRRWRLSRNESWVYRT